MTRRLCPALALAGALVVAGCDYVNPLNRCLLGDTGCALPGRWALVTVDGVAEAGSLQIDEDQFDRSGYGDLPLGLASPPHTAAPERLTGPFRGSFLDDADDPRLFTLAWSVTTPGQSAIWFATLYTDAAVEDRTLTLTVRSFRVPEGIVTTASRFSKLRAGTVLVFRRR